MKYCEFQCGNIENLGRKVVSYVTVKRVLDAAEK